MKILTPLIEQLKPELKAYFETQRQLYPNNVQRVYDHLSSTFYVSDVKYEYIIDLEWAYKNVNKKGFVNAWDCFNRPE